MSSESNSKLVVAITGGSSGIGLETAKILSKTCNVYIISRKEFHFDGLKHICADVCDDSSISNAIATIIGNEGRIDVLVTCAGSGISGAVEFTDAGDVAKQVDVVFNGTVNAVHAVLPQMRKQRSGRIVCVSSVAAVAPIPFQTYYSASKSAVNTFVCATANEVRPYGITICAVMPGDTKTGFTRNRKKIEKGDEEYSGRISRSVQKMENDELNGVSAEKVGKYIAKKTLSKNVKPLYTVGFSYKLITVALKILPIRFANWVLYKMYAK